MPAIPIQTEDATYLDVQQFIKPYSLACVKNLTIEQGPGLKTRYQNVAAHRAKR